MKKMEKKTFPTLFKKLSNGRWKTWTIIVEQKSNKSIYYTINKFDDGIGAVTTSEPIEITKGKNIGKKNEKNHYQVAFDEAERRWKNYHEKQNWLLKKEEVSVSNNLDNFRPMLALEFNKNKHRVTYPVFVQPKIDGIHGIVYKKDDKVIMQTRSGVVLENLEHIESDFENILEKRTNIILNGEFYVKGVKFEDFSGLFMKKYIDDNDKKKLSKIKFWMFDIINLDNLELKYRERLEYINSIKSEFGRNIQFVKTETANNEDDVYKKLKDYTKEGWEGVMIRNPDDSYKVGKRVISLLKLKDFYDDEFEIIDFVEGRGSKKGTIIWVCKCKDSDKTFNVSPTGTHEEREDYFKRAKADFSKYRGKLYTVKYQELTKDGCPRFPSGLRFRDSKL